MRTEVAEVLIDIEAQLRQLGLWDRIPPSSEALASTEPFCVDTLTLPQWLQFVFLPTLYQLLEEEQPLPGRCAITPLAQEYFRGAGLHIDGLMAALQRVDDLLSGE
ncbi:YqcC family protein [Parahaliea mediterranea]|uniref:YqcC family protein n=1 Tax=Parahaliea mediterranea TaxID=651086 RepID=A0A939DHU9_9GAMM|nr:YqcC family protein [Parahaliea mediterranea]MBN7798298.1 YqcC family protein [Parahaliea mediterranea]